MTEEAPVVPMEEAKAESLKALMGDEDRSREKLPPMQHQPQTTNSEAYTDTKVSEATQLPSFTDDKYLVERTEETVVAAEASQEIRTLSNESTEKTEPAQKKERTSLVDVHIDDSNKAVTTQENSMPQANRSEVTALEEKKEESSLAVEKQGEKSNKERMNLPQASSDDKPRETEIQPSHDTKSLVERVEGTVITAETSQENTIRALSDESVGITTKAENKEGTTPTHVQNDDLKEEMTTKESSTSQASMNKVPGEQQKETEMSPGRRRHAAANAFPRHCKTHAPTLDELRSQSFSNFIQKTVLRKASVTYRGESDDVEEESSSARKRRQKAETMMKFTEGIAKVSLPDGFWKEETIGGDQSGRGPAWQRGTPLGDLVITSPMAQNILGVAGVYEYTFTDEKPVSLAEFRDKADEYRQNQVGRAVEEEYTEDRLAQLERQFWKRLGPTMPPAWYGADQEGSLFGNDPASGWSVGDLDSCLHVLSKVPGVTTPYLYAGMWASVFCAHTEDMNLLSINYLHAGAPKIWYAVAPGPDAIRFEALAEAYYTLEARSCKEFLRHKRSLLSPAILRKAGIRYQTAVQMPGEAVITFPGGYHFGFNAGFNMAEATNFGVPEWIPYGLKAKVCLCRPDSVRIDMQRLITLLERYDRAQKKEPELPWKEWSRRREEEKLRRKEQEEKAAVAEALSVLSTGAPSPVKEDKQPKPKLSEQQKKKEFWVEVMKPVSNAMKLKAQQEAAKQQQAKQAKPEPESPQPLGKRVRKKKRHFDEEYDKEEKVEAPKVVREEIWHLAKPIGRKGLELQTRVLCLVPGEVMESTVRRRRSVDIDDEDEQCFAGQVAEVSEDHVRIHFDGLTKAEDAWMEIGSPKLFIDGGHWTDEHEKDGIPKRHYWQESDSKRRCIAK